ncbi:hypothetical protein ODJ79_10675 [Actinoplanes sp. KI2]|uniref:hypothetical protein n=1 Tax=Actinoplanes sp. KI2 TaxID=2983315 RepID=UPI0021D5A363|nr:hypothetical protein [Actinoplanes sp. KI2]MCU7724179.1 hypothetical protein [Actinoplanes sp. KI2]
MPLVPPSRRRRPGLIGVGAAALVVAITAAVTLTASPAAAASSVTPTANCVVKSGKDDTFRVVFGYTSTASQTSTIPAGPNNRLEFVGSTQSTAATVTTDFEPGSHPASFATDWIDKDTTVTWRLDGQSASSSWNQSSCGNNITLPAAGNGAGPVVALLLAGVVAMIVLWRKRRKAA